MTETKGEQLFRVSREDRHILDKVYIEMAAQIDKWGVQVHPDGTDPAQFTRLADVARSVCERAAKNGSLTWRHILREEVYEAFAETDPDALVTELTQVAAVAASWIRDIKSRKAEESP